MRLLKESQEKEDAELRKRTEDEKKLASTPAQKAKVENDAKVKSSQLKKEHEEEKSKISERHQEEKKVVKGKIKKKNNG